MLQINSTSNVQQAPQAGRASDSSKGQKTGSFSSILKAASQKNNSTGSTEPVKNQTDGGKQSAKDEKDLSKDSAAASLAQPGSEYVSQNAQPQVQDPSVSAAPNPVETIPQISALPAAQQSIPAQQVPQAQQAVQTQQAPAVLNENPQVQQIQAQQLPVQQEPSVQTKQEDGSAPKAQVVSNDDAQPVATVQLSADQSKAVPNQQPTQQIPQQAVQSSQQSGNSTEQTTDVSSQLGMVTAETSADDKKSEQSADLSGTRQLSDLYHDGKVVVKVSDSPKEVKTPAANQVADAVTDALKNGKQELKIDLYPQSLGKVTVKLTTQNGMLTVEIAAANPKTQSLLASGSDEIKSILQSSTGRTVQITKPEQNPQYYGQDGNSGRQDAQQQQQQQQQQNAEKQKNLAEWYRIGNTAGINTGDFLAMLRQTGMGA